VSSELPHLRGYRLLEDLGPSRLGRAYRAEQVKLGRIVMIKLLGPELLTDRIAHARFLRGAAAAAKVRHKNLVSLYGVETCPDSEREFAVLEYVEGRSLETLLHERGRLPESQALAIALGVAEGLAALSEHSIVHRFLTPHTILLDSDGRPKLSDLGLAKTGFGARLTGPHEVLGSANYMAPEQALGLKLDARADLYALGVVLHEMLTGRLPGPEGELRGDLTGLSQETLEIVSRLSAPSLADRYPDAQAAVAAFSQRSAGATALAPPKPDPPSFLLDSSSDWTGKDLRVRVRIGEGEPEEHELLGERIQIGRAADCHLRLDTPVVSRHHVELSWQGDVLWAIPRSETNPSAVNGRLFDSPIPLQPGDVLELSGQVQLELRWGGRARRSAKASADEEEEEEVSIAKLFGLTTSELPPATTDLDPGRAPSLSARLESEDDGDSYPLTPYVQAGSSASCTLRLDPGAPRKALVVVASPDGHWLLNVSPDPTSVCVNDEPITDYSRLREGDVISVYGRTLVFRES